MMLSRRFIASFRPLKRNLSFSLPSPRKLDQVMAVEKLENESSESIAHIWKSYYETKNDAVGKIISGMDHSILLSRAKYCPMFIYPLFNKDGGMYWMLSQFQDNFFILTHLEEYKRNPGTATPWLSLHLYPDLIQSKDLCLIRSDFLPNISKQSGEILSEMIIASYIDETDEYYRLIRTFNKEPNLFNVNECRDTFTTIHNQYSEDQVEKEGDGGDSDGDGGSDGGDDDGGGGDGGGDGGGGDGGGD